MTNRNLLNFRQQILGLDEKIPIANGSLVSGINFDNAATTPPFKNVLMAINRFSPWYSSIHRGTGYKSKYSSRLYEESRENISEFVNADFNEDSVIFVKNATEALNKLAFRLDNKNNRDVVLSSFMEHHSNDLPWRDKFKVDYIEIDETGRLSLNDLEKKLNKYKDSIRLVAVAGTSNVTGYRNPIYRIAELAHKYKAEILVDGAQLVPHMPVDMKPKDSPQHIDYLVFSAHKMYAPYGIGVLIGPKSTFDNGKPDYSGGGTIDIVTHDYIKWAEPPHKEEAGSPNIIGVVALDAAVNTLNSLGMENVYRHEKILTDYTIDNLKKIPGIIIYGDANNLEDRLGILPFNVKGIDHETLANILSYEAGIAVRNGCFCAHPYIHRLLNVSQDVIDKRINNPNLSHPGMVRISFGLYNTKREVDVLIDILKKVVSYKDYYINKYSK